MNAREWKPGDVAVAQHPFALNSEVRGIIDTDGRFYTTDQDVRGISSSAFALDNLRPLVVIDPEDREAVERLAETYRVVGDWAAALHVEPWSLPALRMQAALREFANPTPPRPEEPTGLGAVVEASCVHSDYRRRWLRHLDGQWYPHRGAYNPDDWDSLSDVVILYAGYTEDES